MSLCRAPISAQQRLLFLSVDFYTKVSRASLGSSRTESAFPQEPSMRHLASDSRFLWSVSWFGSVHCQNIIRSPAIGRKYQHASVDIFGTRKATTTLIAIARQDPSSHLFLLTYWVFRAVNVTLLPSSDGKTALSLPWAHLGEKSPAPHRTAVALRNPLCPRCSFPGETEREQS